MWKLAILGMFAASPLAMVFSSGSATSPTCGASCKTCVCACDCGCYETGVCTCDACPGCTDGCCWVK